MATFVRSIYIMRRSDSILLIGHWCYPQAQTVMKGILKPRRWIWLIVFDQNFSLGVTDTRNCRVYLATLIHISEYSGRYRSLFRNRSFLHMWLRHAESNVFGSSLLLCMFEWCLLVTLRRRWDTFSAAMVLLRNGALLSLWQWWRLSKSRSVR